MSKAKGNCKLNDVSGKGIGLISSIFDKHNHHHSISSFLPAHGDDLWVWKYGKEIVSALIARRLRLCTGDWVIALGVICTAVNHRKNGFAPSLIESVCQYYKDQGTTLAVLWAPHEMLRFYQNQGFIPVYQDQYCELNETTSSLSCIEALTFGKLRSYDHVAFEKLRLHFYATSYGQSESSIIARTLYAGKWYGISRGFPWSPSFGILFGGSEDAPQFYCILGYGEKNLTILEFVGDPEYFPKTLIWINSTFDEIPIKYNITIPESEQYLERTGVVDRKPALFTLHKALCSARLSAPYTTWLDRL